MGRNMNIQRYGWSKGFCDEPDNFEQRDDGDYIEYKDHLEIVQKLQELLARALTLGHEWGKTPEQTYKWITSEEFEHDNDEDDDYKLKPSHDLLEARELVKADRVNDFPIQPHQPTKENAS